MPSPKKKKKTKKKAKKSIRGIAAPLEQPSSQDDVVMMLEVVTSNGQMEPYAFKYPGPDDVVIVATPRSPGVREVRVQVM